MKKSIKLRLLPILAAVAIAGCDQPYHQACVDNNGVIVAEQYCNGTAGYAPFYHSYYYYGNQYYNPGYSISRIPSTSRGSFTAPDTSLENAIF